MRSFLDDISEEESCSHASLDGARRDVLDRAACSGGCGAAPGDGRCRYQAGAGGCLLRTDALHSRGSRSVRADGKGPCCLHGGIPRRASEKRGCYPLVHTSEETACRGHSRPRFIGAFYMGMIEYDKGRKCLLTHVPNQDAVSADLLGSTFMGRKLQDWQA